MPFWGLLSPFVTATICFGRVSLLHAASQLEKGVDLAADKERAKAGITGMEIAAQIIKECRPYCQGLHIMALGWEAKVPELLKMAGI